MRMQVWEWSAAPRRLRYFAAHLSDPIVALVEVPGTGRVISGIHSYFEFRTFVWDIASGTMVCAFTGAPSGVSAGIAIAPGCGDVWIGGSSSSSIAVYTGAASAADLTTAFHRAHVVTVAAPAAVTALCSISGGRIATGHGDANDNDADEDAPYCVCVWDMATQRRLLYCRGGHRGTVYGLAEMPGAIASCGESPELCVWDLATGALRSRLLLDAPAPPHVPASTAVMSATWLYRPAVVRGRLIAPSFAGDLYTFTTVWSHRAAAVMAWALGLDDVVV